MKRDGLGMGSDLTLRGACALGDETSDAIRE